MSKFRNLKFLVLALAVLLSFTVVTVNVYDAAGDGHDGVTDASPDSSRSTESDAISIATTVLGKTFIDFNDVTVHKECIDTKYAGLGIKFSRDDGHCVHGYDWAGVGFQTVSPPWVLATTSGNGVPTFVQHVNIHIADDAHYVGAYVGNDQVGGMVYTLEIFDVNDNPIDAVRLATNGNTSIDELLEISSATPIRRARYSHTTTSRAIALDDLTVITKLTCNGLRPTIVGTPRDNLLVGTPGDDVIMGLDGSDVIMGRGGDDTICGGRGGDGIFGGDGNDTLFGEQDGDVMDGGSGNDEMSGGPGDDVMVGKQGRDGGNCGGGSDFFNGGGQNDRTNASCEFVVNVP